MVCHYYHFHCRGRHNDMAIRNGEFTRGVRASVFFGHHLSVVIRTSILFQMWLSVSLFIIRLDGSPQYAMWCNVTAALLTVILGWVFIFPMELGIKGAALAASVATAVGGIMGICYLLFRAGKLRVVAIKISRKSLALSIRNIEYQCRIGSSALLGEATLATLMFVGNQVFMKYFGDNGVGAFGIACYYTPFVFMVGNAIAQSAQPILSYNYGMNLNRRVLQAEKIALKTALMCGIVVTVIFYFFPHWLVGLFLPLENEAAKIAIAGLPLFSLGFISFIVNLTAIGYYQSLERIGAATTFALLRGLLILVPAFYLYHRWWEITEYGLRCRCLKSLHRCWFSCIIYIRE